MECLDNVYKRLIIDNIELIDYRILNTDAVTIQLDDTYGIFVDYHGFKTLGEEFVTLAHEYGHCISGATHKLCSPYDLIEQHENRANRAAVHEFLPCSEILNAIEQGYTEVWQIAEYLDIPDEFVILAIEIYTAEQRL